MKTIFIIALLFAQIAQAKPLISLTQGCFTARDLELYEFPNLKAGVRIYSAEAEYEWVFKAKSCVVIPGDVWRCEYSEVPSGRFDRLKATLYPSGYDPELNGEFWIESINGKICRYRILE